MEILLLLLLLLMVMVMVIVIVLLMVVLVLVLVLLLLLLLPLTPVRHRPSILLSHHCINAEIYLLGTAAAYPSKLDGDAIFQTILVKSYPGVPIVAGRHATTTFEFADFIIFRLGVNFVLWVEQAADTIAILFVLLPFSRPDSRYLAGR